MKNTARQQALEDMRADESINLAYLYFSAENFYLILTVLLNKQLNQVELMTSFLQKDLTLYIINTPQYLIGVKKKSLKAMNL